jgi:tRNA-2-methylthio-N6-dimethylallyladenosine synthase
MKFFIKTFGCQMNKADSESIAAILCESGHGESANAGEADLIIINTCNVREHAVSRLTGHIRSIKPRARAGLKPWIAVGGCVGEMSGDELFSALPQVDILFGTKSFHRLPVALSRLQKGESGISLVKDTEALPAQLPYKPVDPVREWLPISRGCDNYCSYCVVPYARGREVSLPYNNIVKNAEGAVLKGAREITLLGQNVNSYGNDRGEKDAFAGLLRRLDRIPDLKRLRFLTSHPKDLSDATIEAIAECASVCEYVHLPLQAGSDRILDLMNRSYTLDGYLDLIAKLRRAVPGVALSTDIIVGFPGETEEEFEMTLSAVKAADYDAAYTFVYSPRAGTKASTMPDHVSRVEKEARLKGLIALQSKISLKKNTRLIGETLEVFIERPSRRGGSRQAGRTRTNKMVNCLAAESLTNRFVTVKIDQASEASLKGTVCGLIE